MRALGNIGEQLAAEYLISQDYEILVKGYRWKHGEIDIIAQDKTCAKKVLAFIEVKYYKVNSLRNLRTAVSAAKQKHIVRTAERYLREHRITDSYVRFDVVLISYTSTAQKIDLIKDAFRG